MSNAAAAVEDDKEEGANDRSEGPVMDPFKPGGWASRLLSKAEIILSGLRGHTRLENSGELERLNMRIVHEAINGA